ncbi:N(4)-(Beta-N-acetylglucosaminyl)-L-asparaginase-like isoform X3 [Helicoverpa zea]|uniref:N(4)-(Beta-N-acetylglucosaminyl)-L-asparaginase- like isoform X3 n=1 Tax=Helicoverpa zea TaxID=7113 RepID=UPI001F582353|nr:N(4)-(Beta-N-acetylglucosaminyl)-L-asparaginase-like isoform X3 [Helicoverpa zea]
MLWLSLILLSSFNYYVVDSEPNVPVVITTWWFSNATVKAWEVLKEGGTALDAVEQGASVCEVQQCDGTVGYGGSPDENGETTLDALIMDGRTMNVGAVAALRRIKSAISVARHVLEHTKHSFLAGELATQFAVQMGFHEESLTTAHSKQLWLKWHNENHCQPNFWMGVKPDPTKQCGPYHEIKKNSFRDTQPEVHMIVDRYNHDTIGMVAVDSNGDVAAGTSTNGAKYKIPGFLAVEEMRRGASPTDATQTAVKRIAAHYPDFMGAVIALTKTGQYGAACHGIPTFPFVVQDKTRNVFEVITIKC